MWFVSGPRRCDAIEPFADLGEAMVAAFENLEMYDPDSSTFDQENPRCTQSPSTLGAGLASDAMEWWSKTIWGDPSEPGKLCGIPAVAEILNEADEKLDNFFDGCTFEDGEINCEVDVLAPWDGTVKNSDPAVPDHNVFDPARVNGSLGMKSVRLGETCQQVVAEAGAPRPVLSYNCDGYATILAGSAVGISFAMPNISFVGDLLETMMSRIIQCRVGSEMFKQLEEIEKSLLYRIWQLPTWANDLMLNKESDSSAKTTLQKSGLIPLPFRSPCHALT